jgi:RNA polymerase sigma factor (sigma-70 family)
MISVDGLTVEFGDRALFKDISFQINEKDRIALMGKNGAGKSTLLKILAGQRKPSRGNVSAPKDTVIAYLPQHLMTEDGRSVYEEASQAFAPLFAMEKRIDDLNRQLTERTDYDSPEYYKLIEEVSALSEKYYSIDLTHFEADVEKTLLGLGFKRELAKDLVQDVFLKLYKSYPYFSSEVNIKSWLYTSSRNAALDYLRHLKVRDNNKLLMAEAMMYAADVDEVISEELTRKIHEAIDSLPLQCCQIVRMHIIDGKKYTEISVELGISINTIKTQIFRGYKKLRELLADDLNALVLFYFHIVRKENPDFC